MTAIKDGKGRGNLAEVNSSQQLEVSAKILTAFAKSSEEGGAFAWTAATADLAAADTALLVANNSQTKKLRITKIYVYSDVPTRVQIHLPAYPTLAGTVVTGVCLNKSLNKVADASAYADETGNTQGNIIKVLDTNELTTDQFGVSWDFEGAVILGYHDSIAVDIVGDSAAFGCSVEGYFE
jgi:hypothetical protein